MKRILLLALTNLGVLAVLFITWNLLQLFFGVQLGRNFTGIAVMALVFGFGGAFISLFMSKWMAKRSMGVQIIEHPHNAQERWLLETVRQQAEKADIGMPEVGIFRSPSPNAFATGANRNNALVAVSTGLLQNMTADEVEAVLGHEIGHVTNGDMVTQTLLQGVVNTFVIVFARVIGMAVDNLLRRGDDRGGVGIGYYIGSMIAEVLLGFVATAIVMWFSRYREFRADEAGARLAGREKMIAALQRLQQTHAVSRMPSEMQAFGIIPGMADGLQKLFTTHPPLEDRIASLQKHPG
ncbi:MAG: protease HtpX [Proteobacteria bacterium]|nr:MAG: protease HtpX [Pseudomonadota bacterium]